VVAEEVDNVRIVLAEEVVDSRHDMDLADSCADDNLG